jgi:hypothetical protein
MTVPRENLVPPSGVDKYRTKSHTTVEVAARENVPHTNRPDPWGRTSGPRYAGEARTGEAVRRANPPPVEPPK